MKSTNTFIDCVTIAIFILAIGGLTSAFWGFPKGIDAYVHLTFTEFISNNWPHSRWFSYWYSGFPFSLSYAPLPYYLSALVMKATNWSAELTLNFLLALSYCLVGIGFYALVYEATKRRIAALTTSFLIFSSTPVWNTLVSGGAYARIMAMIFLPFSSWVAFRYVKRLKEGQKVKHYYSVMVVISSVGFTFHLQVGAFTLAATLLIVFFGIGGLKNKVIRVITLFIPIVLLSSYFYIPFFVSNPLRRFMRDIHLPGPVDVSWMILQLSSVLLVASIALLTIKWLHTRFDYLSRVLLKAFGTVIFSLLLYSFMSIPPQLYVFSPYDSPTYLVLFIATINGLFTASIFTHPKIGNTKWPQILGLRNYLVFPVLLGVLLLLGSAMYPVIQSHVVNTGVKTPESGIYFTQQLVRIDPEQRNFRLGTDWDGVALWFNYFYSVPQTEGYFPLGILNPKWQNWIKEAVWKQRSNYEETKYLLDWYAVKWLVVAWPHHNYDKFLAEPDSYELIARANTSTLGEIFEFAYEYAAPVVEATNTSTILVIGNNNVYDGFFRSLAYSDYNSRHVIPIRGHQYVDDYTLEDLQKFDALFVALYDDYYRNSDKAWELLREYVERGGGVIIETGNSEFSLIPEPSPVSRVEKANLAMDMWNFSHVDSQLTKGVNFSRFSLPRNFSFSSKENVRELSRIVLWNYGFPVTATREYGDGRIVWSGLGLSHHINTHKNTMESFFLSRILKWVSMNPGTNQTAGNKQNHSSMDWSMSRTSQEKVEVNMKNVYKGLLFKESYLEWWSAHMIDSMNKSYNLEVHRAGPDFMYIPIPKDAGFPVKVVVEYNFTQIEQLSYFTSFLTLSLLIVYSFGGSVTWLTPKVRKLISIKK